MLWYWWRQLVIHPCDCWLETCALHRCEDIVFLFVYSISGKYEWKVFQCIYNWSLFWFHKLLWVLLTRSNKKMQRNLLVVSDLCNIVINDYDTKISASCCFNRTYGKQHPMYNTYLPQQGKIKQQWLEPLVKRKASCMISAPMMKVWMNFEIAPTK